MNLSEKISFLFSGIAYISVGFLILVKPQFLYYWVAGIFLIQGVVSFIRAFTGSPSRK